MWGKRGALPPGRRGVRKEVGYQAVKKEEGREVEGTRSRRGKRKKGG